MIRLRHCVTGLLLLSISAPAWAGGKNEPGAYCPFPEPGQTPQCMDPARAEYGDVFAALDDGAISDEQLETLEADVAAGAGSENAYLALTSITFVYYTIAQQAAASPAEDPGVVRRLERLNALLSGAYRASADDVNYRDAMQSAAQDLQRRAPAVSLQCVDDAGQPAECQSTEALLHQYAAVSDEIGIRGALRKLLQRITGGPDT